MGENGYCESFNAHFLNELLDEEVFYMLREAQNLIERWRKHYSTVRPHSALGYRPPMPESVVSVDRNMVYMECDIERLTRYPVAPFGKFGVTADDKTIHYRHP